MKKILIASLAAAAAVGEGPAWGRRPPAECGNHAGAGLPSGQLEFSDAVGRIVMRFDKRADRPLAQPPVVAGVRFEARKPSAYWEPSQLGSRLFRLEIPGRWKKFGANPVPRLQLRGMLVEFHKSGRTDFIWDRFIQEKNGLSHGKPGKAALDSPPPAFQLKGRGAKRVNYLVELRNPPWGKLIPGEPVHVALIVQVGRIFSGSRLGQVLLRAMTLRTAARG